VSRQAIAAALAGEDLAGGERLVAFSLASFGGRDGRAWPGAPAAAARAGLSRSRYLYDRDQLVRRGLIVMEEMASGRGRASTVALQFAAEGPWWDGDVNAELFEAALSRTRTRGPARLLLAAMAALADPDGVVRGVSSEELCLAAGVADRTYRRARRELLESGELALLSGAVGRGNTNVWQVRASAEIPAPRRRTLPPWRVVPPAGARPLLAPLPSPAGTVGVDEAGQRVDPGELGSGVAAGGKCPDRTGISTRKGRSGQDGFRAELSWLVRCFDRKGRSGQDTFRATGARNPGGKPGRNPGSQHARGKGTPEPQNRGPPQPP